MMQRTIEAVNLGSGGIAKGRVAYILSKTSSRL
jgi:hypothetical protein